jgi:Ca2+:H+ antiporter
LIFNLVFTEELAAHTNDIIGGLINATFGNAVELVVAIQALLAEDYRVVQASLIGSVFSNLMLVLGMCFFVGGLKYDEQKFIALGAVASIALLALSGLTLYLPQQFVASEEDVVTISRIGAFMLVIMYAQLLYFQLKTHAHLFNAGEDGEHNEVALIPFSWALIGLVVITAIVTILSEFLVGSIDGFCEEFRLGRSFVGVIILPIVGNAVEHISAVSVAYKNKMDLALGGKQTVVNRDINIAFHGINIWLSFSCTRFVSTNSTICPPFGSSSRLVHRQRNDLVVSVI